jgi:hypothetical protein
VHPFLILAFLLNLCPKTTIFAQFYLYLQQNLPAGRLYFRDSKLSCGNFFYSSCSGARMLKRTTVNFIVDFVAFLDLLALAFTGSIMKYILPPGSAGHGQGFRGGRGFAEIKYLWSMDRHEWGGIHFYLAVIFAVLMLIHILLHWTWIKCYFKSLLGRSRNPA